MFEGVYAALVTPFTSGGNSEPQIDWESWERLLAWQLDCGIDGVVIYGTTGESATLTKDEKLELTRRTIAQVKGRVPVIAGTGSNNTADSIAMTKAAAELGVDAALVVAPYYNKPSQDGLYQHFVSVAEAGGLPLIVYNVPGRTVSHVSVATFARLAQHPQIVACKQAVDSIAELMQLSRLAAPSFDILAGDDAMTFSVLACGGTGVISATASVFPEEMLAITRNYRKGQVGDALQAQQQLLPIIDALFSETNPCPAKAALRIKGIISDESVRLPLVPVREDTRERLQHLIQRLESPQRKLGGTA